MSGYEYYWRSHHPSRVSRRPDAALRLSNKRFQPKLSDPDYLILSNRTEYFRKCLMRIETRGLHVLDVGGRLQPYRPLLDPVTDEYIAIDPQMEGLADIVAVAERLPFQSEHFDIVICTQVLSYVEDPVQVIAEMHRVLRSPGYLFISVPAYCPQFFDERWRFLRDGLQHLLDPFEQVEIFPEVYSFGGFIRTINKCLDQTHSKFGKRFVRKLVVPLLNRFGRRLDGHVYASEFFTSNYSAFARK